MKRGFNIFFQANKSDSNQRIKRSYFGLCAALIGIFVPSLGSFADLQARTDVKTPGGIADEILGIQDKFQAVLDEECLGEACYSKGCVLGRFTTLDQNQDSSLPGLETDSRPAKQPQYKLASVRCEFAYEPSVDQKQIQQLRQRLVQRVKPVGVAITVRAKRLAPRTNRAEKIPPEEGSVPVYTSWQEGAKQTTVPMIPWLILLFSCLLFLVIAIWAFRRLGVRGATVDSARNSRDFGPHEPFKPATVEAEPTPLMIMTRLQQMKQTLEADTKLVEFTLRPYFEKENYAELCLFLKHFGPEFIGVFREKAEFRGSLGTLSQVYNESEQNESNVDLWKYLDRLDRAIVSAKVKINNEPLEDEFAFLGSLGVDELLGLLDGCTNLESVAAISYAPQKLREDFFAVAPASLTSKIVMELTKVDRMPDALIRQTAQKLRKHYNKNAQNFKTVEVNKNPLIEIALNSLGEQDRRDLITGMRLENQGALKELSPAIFLDETILYIEDDMLTEVFLEIAPRDAAAYLANFEWADDVLKRLKQRVREPIKKFSQNPDLLDFGVMSEVRAKIAMYLRKRDAAGALSLADINEKLMGTTEA